MLAGLPKAPSAFNPLANPDRAMIRRNWILGRMRDLGYITPDAHELAVSAPITASYNRSETAVDADYLDAIARSEMARRIVDDAYTAGYTVPFSVDR